MSTRQIRLAPSLSTIQRSIKQLEATSRLIYKHMPGAQFNTKLKGADRWRPTNQAERKRYIDAAKHLQQLITFQRAAATAVRAKRRAGNVIQ